MVLNKLLQIKISEELHKELILEAITSGLTISEVSRLRLLNKKIVEKSTFEKENKPKFRPVQSFKKIGEYNE